MFTNYISSLLDGTLLIISLKVLRYVTLSYVTLCYVIGVLSRSVRPATLSFNRTSSVTYCLKMTTFYLFQSPPPTFAFRNLCTSRRALHEICGSPGGWFG